MERPEKSTRFSKLLSWKRPSLGACVTKDCGICYSWTCDRDDHDDFTRQSKYQLLHPLLILNDDTCAFNWSNEPNGCSG